MKKLAIATAAVALMSLAACGGKPEEGNNAANATVVNATENAANAIDNAANATQNAANAAGNVANAAK